MERAEWLKRIRGQTEALYDRIAPAYWIKFGFYDNEVHRQFLEKFLKQLGKDSSILDAACGAGRYDGILLEAGHSVLGTDQSGSMLTRGREHFPADRFPKLSFAKVGLQEINFQAKFDGVICIDAMEHIFPEDWPGIVRRFEKALQPGGVFYFTVEVADPGEVREAYEQAKAQGLPVVYGEMADKIEVGFSQIEALDWQVISGDQAAMAAYHYYPPLEQVRTWLGQAGLVIEEEGNGDGYAHFLAKKPG